MGNEWLLCKSFRVLLISAITLFFMSLLLLLTILKKLMQKLFAIRFVISSAPRAELAYEPAPSDSAIATTLPDL